MSIPRGFALLFADLAAGSWTWRAQSRRGTAPEVVVTMLTAHRDGITIVGMWTDGSWATGLVRHPADPVPVPIGALRLRPIVRGAEPAPRWVRPDLDAPREGSKSRTPRGDEGTPAHERWSPDIEARVQAGMDRIAHYGRTRQWT